MKKNNYAMLLVMRLGIEHIGSTSIPGIWAKPIVDIMIGVKSLPLEKSQICKVIELGYEYLGEAGVSGRIYFRKRFPKAYNVHITQFGNLIWNNNILLRDFLRSNKDEAMRYSELKKDDNIRRCKQFIRILRAQG